MLNTNSHTDIPLNKFLNRGLIISGFESILSIRESHGTTFDQSDLYVICRLRPLSSHIDACTSEIDACDWLNVYDVLGMPESTPLVKLVCQLLVEGGSGGEESFSRVDFQGKRTQSWIDPDKYFMIYSRPQG